MKATSAPRRASSRHTARPMPRLPPVTSAFLSAKSRLSLARSLLLSLSLIALSRPSRRKRLWFLKRQVARLDLLAFGTEALERRMIDHLALDHDVDHIGHGFGELEV